MDYENPIKLRHDPLIWLEVERDFNHDQRIVGGCNLAINEIKSLRSSIKELQTNTKPTKETLLEYIDAFRRAGTTILVTSNLHHEQMMIARSELNKLIKRRL